MSSEFKGIGLKAMYGHRSGNRMTCVCRIISTDQYALYNEAVDQGGEWTGIRSRNGDSVEFMGGADRVVYPDLACRVSNLVLVPKPAREFMPPHIQVDVSLYAEGMPSKRDRFWVSTGFGLEFAYP